MKLDFHKRAVIVTGGGNGIGEHHALEFGRRGAHVVVNDINGQGANRVAKAIVDEGGKATACVCSAGEGEQLAEAAMSVYGRVDVVIHNAGIIHYATIEELEPADWQRLMQVNVDTAYQLSKAVWPIMKAQQHGRMLFTSSPVVPAGTAMYPHYVTSKTALLGLMLSLACDGREHGIFCNAVQPFASGGMFTEGTDEKYWELFSPRYIAAMAAALCHESSVENGSCFELGAGHIHKVRTQMSAGVYIPEADYSAEAIAAQMPAISDFSGDNIDYRLGDWATVWNEVMKRTDDDILVL